MEWAFAPLEDAAAPEVVHRTCQRTAARAGRTWISDGRRVYRRSIRRIYRDPLHTGRRGRPRLLPTAGVGLVQAVKLRRGGRLVRIEVHPRFGDVVPECTYTVCVERLNGVLRDRLACLTRKTHAFAKREQTWDAAVGLCLFEHNWMRPLRAAPRGGTRSLDRAPLSPALPCDGAGLERSPLVLDRVPFSALEGVTASIRRRSASPARAAGLHS